MTRSIGKVTALTLAAFLAGGLAPSCSSNHETGQGNSQTNVGSIGFELEIADGVIVNSIHYVITGNGITPITGDIDVSDEGSTGSARVGQIPAGTGYLVELTADSTDGTHHCLGSASFNIVAGQTTNVPVTLQCRADDPTGEANINAEFNNCPVIEELDAAPLVAGPGAEVTLASTGSDLDGDTLTFAWTSAPTGNTIANAAADDTTFTCSVSGDYTITLTVSDGMCDAMRDVMVSCAVLSCGNGVVDQGEQCDPGPDRTSCDANNCDASCRTEACGNGRVECTEACEPSLDPNCRADCLGSVGCGNGVLEAGEGCDDNNMTACDGCSAMCETEGCGNGTVECTEQCDDGNTTSGDCCSSTCTDEPSPPNACQVCETASCPDRIEGAATGVIDPEAIALLECMHDSNCAAPPNLLEACYCGFVNGVPVSTAACLAPGGAVGDCRAEVEAAAAAGPATVTDPLTISELFVDPSVPLGTAFRLIRCDQQFCATPAGTCFPYPAGLCQ